MTPRAASRRRVLFAPFDPCDRGDVAAMAALIDHMHPTDRAEILGLRDDGPARPTLLMDLCATHASRAHIVAFLIWACPERPGQVHPVPVAYAGAWRKAPKLASLGFFGRADARRWMPDILCWLAVAREDFGARHGVTLGEAKVLTRYAAARKWQARLGGEAIAELGDIGRWGESYTQMVWRL